jgi:hypothetical protein
LTGGQWIGFAIDDNLAGRPPDVKKEMPLTVGMRNHRAVHRVQTDTSECPVKYGNS